MEETGTTRTGSLALFGALTAFTALVFGVADRLGGTGQEWALALVLFGGALIASRSAHQGEVLGGLPGSLAASLLVYLAVHAAFVGDRYLAVMAWIKWAVPVLLFLMAAVDRDDRSGSVVRVGLTVSTLLAALAAYEQLFDAQAMPSSWIDPDRYHRILFRLSSLFANPNLYGAYLALVLPLHLAWYLESESGLSAIVQGVAATTSVTFLLYSFSRGAWLSGLAGVMILAWGARSIPFDRRMRARLWIVVVSLLLAIIGGRGALGERLSVSRDSGELGIAQRKALYRGVIKGVLDHPFVGFGLGSFSSVFPRFREQGGYYPREAHSSILQLAFEAGLPVAFLYVALVTLIVWNSLRRRSTSTLADSAEVASCLSAFIAFQAVSGVSYLQLDLPFMVILASVARQSSPSVRLRITFPMAVCVLVGTGLWILAAAVDTSWRTSGEGASRIAALERAVRWMPFRADLWNELGETRELAGDLSGAFDAYRRGLKLCPSEGRILASRARVRCRRGDRVGALADLDAALVTDPFSEELLVDRSVVMILLGRESEAVEGLERALSTNPQYLALNPSTYRKAATLLLGLHRKAGRPRDACRIESIARSLERAPSR